MKRLFPILLLFPFLLSFQCEDELDTGFETQYVIQNTLSSDLFLLNEGDTFVEIPAETSVIIGSVLNSETSPIAPSASGAFQHIRLYTREGQNYILVYTQDPLDDTQWLFEEPSVNRYDYTLVISPANLD